MAELGAFSESVLIMRGDRVLKHVGYGTATETPCVLAGPETVYHVGSLGKQFAATAALLLEERGRWSVQDPISRFLPDAPSDKRSITLHQLLTHTSGLPAEVVGYGAEQRPIHRDTILARILRAPLVAEPGAGYRYSNAGYSLLTILIERVAADPDPGVYRDGTRAFRLTRDPDGALWLAPVTGDAFRALRGGAPELDARAAAAFRRSAALEDSLLAVDRRCSSARTARDPDAPRQYVEDWSRLPCDLEGELGPHLETESVDARPLSWSRSRTFVFRRHVHVGSSRVVTWLWDDGELPVEAWQSPATDLPQGVRLARTAEGFGVFDWFTGTILPVPLKRGPGGERELRIREEEGSPGGA